MTHRRQVYIVDDEVLIAKTLAQIFQESGYATEYFTSPFALLELVHAHPPDVLVTDCLMPGMTGVELASKVFAICPRCLMILISGTDLSLIQTHVGEEPMPKFTFFSKPVQVKQLLQVVELSLRSSPSSNDIDVGLVF